MRIEIENLKSKIITDNPELLNALIDVYSFSDPASKYVNRYKKGKWDGKIHFIQPTGYFKTGLLENIKATLKKVDLVPEEQYIEKCLDTEVPKRKDLVNVDLYNYQKEYVDKLLQVRRGILESSTGSGKTEMMACLVASLYPRKILILFNQKQILTQTYERFKKILPKESADKVGINFGEGYIYGDIMLSTTHSIEKLIGTPIEKPDVIMADEIHEFCSGKFNSKLISSFPTAWWRIGFTATVPTEKIKRYVIEGALGPVIKLITTEQLIEDKRLAKPIIQIIPLHTEYNDYLTYIDAYDKFIVNNKFRNNLIINIIEKIRSTRSDAKIMILVQSLSHGEILNSSIPNSIKLEGKDNIPIREKEIAKFIKKNKSPVLIGTRILQTGVNIPEITHFINCRGLKSDVATKQALGRALRITDTKDIVHVYDFYDRQQYLEKHAKARVRAYKSEGHEVEMMKEIIYEY